MKTTETMSWGILETYADIFSLMRKSIPFFFACLLLTSCGNTLKDKSVAETQIAAFHERLDAGRYDEIYNTATEVFKKAIAREKVDMLFSAINRKLGSVKLSRIANWSVNTRNLTTYVTLVSETQFEKGTGTETFTFEVSGTSAALNGYFINSSILKEGPSKGKP